MREVISLGSRYETYFRLEMENRLRIQSEETLLVSRKRMTQAEKRIEELDRLFLKIYEDNANHRLSDDRFAMMSRTYEEEQTELRVEVRQLKQDIEAQEKQAENLDTFIDRAKTYSSLEKLTPYALRELVKAVYVEAPDKSSGKRKQRIHIVYDLIGFIPVEELMSAKEA